MFSDELKSLRDEMIAALKQDDDDLAKLLRKRSQEQRQLFLGLYRYSGELLQVAGQYDRIQLLVDLMPDVDVNEANSRGRTALHAAAENGNFATVKTLLQREAKWDVRDDRGMLPLHSALRSRSPNIDVVRLLVEKCAQAGSEGSQASLGGFAGRREWLYGPVDNMGNTPLHVAATNIAAGYEGCLQCVQELRRFDPCAKNNRGDTPLHVAAKRGYAPLLEAMLKVFYGYEKNVCQHPANSEGDTLLDIAATGGFEDLVVLLLDYGADPRQGVLFKIVSESVRKPGLSEDMRRMYRLIIASVGKWSNGQDGEEVVNIINSISDQNGGKNVVELAIDEGAVAMLKEIVHTSVLYEFESGGKYRFLVRHCLPSKGRISLIERMVSGDKVQIGSDMLSIQPFSFLSSQYLWYSSVMYAVFFVFQLIYMVLFSYFCIPNACKLSDHFQLEAAKCGVNDGEPTSYGTTIKNKVAFIVWPIFTLIFTICLKLYQLGGNVFVRRYEFVGLAFSLSFGTVVIIWFVALVKADSYDLYTGLTAFLFILGWLQTFYYLSYLGELYIFTNLVKAIIINDVLKLASILVFVVVGFSFAIHSIAQTGTPSSNRTLTDTVYLTFASTLNLGDLFDDTMGDSAFAQAGGNLDLLRVIFIAYLIAAFLILFNVLIAMMSDTYQQKNRNARAVWRYDVLKVSLALILIRRFKVVEPVLPEEVAGPIIRSLPESEEAKDKADAKLLPF